MDFSPMIVTVGPSPMNEPAVLSQLVGIPVTQLDRSAFTYMRYLYRDGSFIVLIFDTVATGSSR